MKRRTWRARPPSSSPGARYAWDLMANQWGVGAQILRMWYAAEMDDGAWCFELATEEIILEIDALITRQRVNHDRAARRFSNTRRPPHANR